MESLIPLSIDKYKVVGILGSGATSTVYLAYDAFTEREVAVKLFDSALVSDPEYGYKFRKLIVNEASLVGRLNHPHIVGIYDASLNPDKCYIVMEYVQGESLEKYGHPESLLPIDQVIEIVFKCALALDFAGSNGVIHRDIKLANIMIREDGEVKIADFGAAVLARSDKTELVGVGSPAYMSPEQLRLDTLTQQTDIYSLGVVMYRLLTGRMPFEDSSSYGLTHKILNMEAPHICDLRPVLPQRLDDIVAKAMNKQLEERYFRGRDFAQDLAENAKLDLPQNFVSDTEKFNTLRSLAFFRDFGEVELWEVMRISVWGHVPAGTILVSEGDEGDFFFILADGEVKISKGGKTLGIQGAGQCFGEMSYIQKGRITRSATVTTYTPVILIKIKPDSLRKASDSCQHKFDSAFLRILVDRLAKADIDLAGMH